jgi:hypothetical protein
MRTIWRRALFGAAAVALTVAGSARAAGDEAGRFDSILAIAKKNVGTPAGAAYDKAFGAAMQAQLGMQMAKCFTRTPKPDTSKFDMLIQVDARGKAGEVLLRPETNVALCFRPRIGEATFPPPPAPAYWVRVEMDVTN